jgi:hypothetical protein
MRPISTPRPRSFRAALDDLIDRTPADRNPENAAPISFPTQSVTVVSPIERPLHPTERFSPPSRVLDAAKLPLGYEPLERLIRWTPRNSDALHGHALES